MLEVSDTARDKLLALLKAEGKEPQEFGLRLGVRGGGCSGLSYVMAFDQAREGDQVFTNGDARVIVDSRSQALLEGSILDYTEGLQGSGFAVRNPNVTGQCGCGSSFSV